MPTSEVRRLSRDAVIRAHIADARERVGCVPVHLPPGGGLTLSGDAEALARASVEHGGALSIYGRMLLDGQVGPEDRHLLPHLHREVMEAIGALCALWLWAQMRAGEDAA